MKWSRFGASMRLTGKRIFTAVMLVGTAITTYQLLSKPQPVAPPLNAGTARVYAQAFGQKLEQLETPRTEGSAPTEVHFTSDEVSAEMAQAVGAIPTQQPTATRAANSPQPSPDSQLGAGQVEIKGYQVKLEGDLARGQFLTQVAGKDVYVTLAGHLGSQDGYVTFDPTEFKIGDLSIPASLLNSALQKQLEEQREQLKLPPGIGNLRVENSELVITQK
jgi:hypothetical protein